MTFIPVLLLSLCVVIGGGAAAKDFWPAIFVFGDSHVDSGNNNYLLTSLSKANFPPNGIDFVHSGGLPTGRFTNGRTIADILGFAKATDACCGNGGAHGGLVPCGPTTSLCRDRSEYVYWDPYHPTEKANLIVTKKLIEGDGRCISPMNVEQLINI